MPNLPDIVDQAREIQADIVNWRRELHRIPEVGLDLPKTAAYITDRLQEMGIDYRAGIGGSGIVALIAGNGMAGKTIALRADMDALPIREETGLTFSSTNRNMHACGHDAHAAMLLGAAKILNAVRDQIKGQVKLIFQAGEEGPGGAKPMIDAGVLENPAVSAIFALHIGYLVDKELRAGQVGIRYGQCAACLDRFHIKIKGCGGHGAFPDLTVDPVVIAAQVINMFQSVISREVKPTNPAVLSIGKIRGGTAYNIIPDQVEMEGTVRATDKDERAKIARRMQEILTNVTEAMRGSCEFEYTFGYPPLVNDRRFTQYVGSIAGRMFGGASVKEIAHAITIGEDMAYFLEQVPGAYVFLGGGDEAGGFVHSHHTSGFDLDESVFWRGTALLAQVAVEWLATGDQAS